jgi:hypothetical protein
MIARWAAARNRRRVRSIAVSTCDEAWEGRYDHDGPRGRPEEDMTSGISGAGGAGGPKGPADVGPTDEPEAAPVGEAGTPLEVHAAHAAAAGGVETAGIDRIAADLDAGRITGREALDRLIDEAVPGEMELDAAERAELREAMAELIANDPHLAALAARIGAGRDD